MVGLPLYDIWMNALNSDFIKARETNCAKVSVYYTQINIFIESSPQINQFVFYQLDL